MSLLRESSLAREEELSPRETPLKFFFSLQTHFSSKPAKEQQATFRHGVTPRPCLCPKLTVWEHTLTI